MVLNVYQSYLSWWCDFVMTLPRFIMIVWVKVQYTNLKLGMTVTGPSAAREKGGGSNVKFGGVAIRAIACLVQSRRPCEGVPGNLLPVTSFPTVLIGSGRHCWLKFWKAPTLAVVLSVWRRLGSWTTQQYMTTEMRKDKNWSYDSGKLSIKVAM